VKTKASFSNSQEKAAIEAMKKQTAGAISKGLCLLFVLNNKPSSTFDQEILLAESDWEKVANEVVFKTVIIPDNDCFGITDIAKQTKVLGGDLAEVFASHSFFSNQVSKSNIADALRSTLSNGQIQYITELCDSLKNITD